MKINLMEKCLDGIYGLAVGDAVGIPVEFISRELLDKNPVTDMLEYGTHNQPKGTWSDDTSMALAMMDAFSESAWPEPDYDLIMKNFVKWYKDGEYSPNGEVFDIGRTCYEAIRNYMNGSPALRSGVQGDYSCGNGALMRILPAAFYFLRPYAHCETNEDPLELIDADRFFKTIFFLTSITHNNMRCCVANCIYVLTAIYLMYGEEKDKAVKKSMEIIRKYSWEENIPMFKETKTYHRLHHDDFKDLPREQIASTGYVVHTLEAALWAFLSTDNYKDCILKAVNLGWDTDTCGAVAGGLAGLYYGRNNIPEEWRKSLLGVEVLNRITGKIADATEKE